MLDKIRQLEAIARRLDPAPGECTAMLGEVGAYARSFLAGLPAARTYVQDSGVDGFADYPLQETGAGLSELLGFFHREVDTHRHPVEFREDLPQGFPRERPSRFQRR